MKGDFTRFTFDPKKHFNRVLMQQGRVILDADWNEQADIQNYIQETEVFDVVGRSGAPIDFAGFKVEVASDGRDLVLSPGRMYVDGILCELDENLRYFENVTFPSEKQAKLPSLNIDDMDLEKGQWIEISVKDDQQIQPQMLKIEEINAAESILTFNEKVNDNLSAQATSSGIYIKIFLKIDYQPDFDVQASETYLAHLDVWERHITAVEDGDIREKALDGPDTTTRTKTEWRVKLIPCELENKSCREASLKLENLTHERDSRLAVRLQPSQGEFAEDPCAALSGTAYQGLENQLYRVEIHEPGETGKATFKWSRNNGAIAFAIVDFIEDDSASKESANAETKTEPKLYNKVKLQQLGWDQELRIHKDDWIEVLGDETELLGEPGTLARVEDIDEADLILTLTADVAKYLEESNPKVRRWDKSEGKGILTESSSRESGWIELENGIEVCFKTGDYYRTGDYWMIAARNTGEIEWPHDENDFVPKFGIQHHNCPLAILARNQDGTWKLEKDCRKLFPPLTDMVFLSYAGGDGQEAMPGYKLPAPFRVRVSRGERPVEGAKIAFELLDGQGVLNPAGSVLTGTDGIAQCTCQFNSKLESLYLRVRAELIDVVCPDENGAPSHPSIIFNANASVAEQVAYVPPKECLQLDDAKTVRDAINSLCRQVSFSCAGGDGQEAMPGNELPGPLRVRVARGSYPVGGAEVHFKIDGEKGKLRSDTGETGPELDIATDANGMATCFCTLNENARIEAKLIAPTPTDQSPIWFNANVSVAEQVAYAPPKECLQLGGDETVKDAIDGLCRQVSFAYAGGDGQEAISGEELSVPFTVRVSRGSYPVRDATVNFKIETGRGELRKEKNVPGQTEPLEIPTDENGIAKCFFKLDERAEILATLIKPKAVDQSYIRFFAGISNAQDVAYLPPNECAQLKGSKTVKDAIDGLCRQVSFAYAGGDGQEAISGEELSVPFTVRVSRGSYPVKDATVNFKIETGKGELREKSGASGGNEHMIPTDENGIAKCFFRLDESAEILATLIDPKAVDKSYIRFFAGLSNAQNVAYLPPNECGQLKGSKTVKEAIDKLCLYKTLTTWVHGNSLHLQTTKEEKIVDISPRYDDKNGQVAVVKGEKGSSSKICFSIPVTMDPNNKTLPTAVAAVLRARANEKLDGMIYISDGETTILEGKIAISNNWENIRFALADKSISLGIGITLIINFSSTNEIWFSAAGCTIKSNF